MEGDLNAVRVARTQTVSEKETLLVTLSNQAAEIKKQTEEISKLESELNVTNFVKAQAEFQAENYQASLNITMIENENYQVELKAALNEISQSEIEIFSLKAQVESIENEITFVMNQFKTKIDEINKSFRISFP